MAKVKKNIFVGKKFGVTGNAGYMGASDTGEYLQQLTGLQGINIFDEMRRSDGQIKAVLKAITLPVLRNKYYIEPASDEPKDVEIAEMLEENLFREMTMTWSDTLKHIMLHKPFGFMPMEKIYEYREDKKLIKLRKLDPRMPQSVCKWNYEGQSLISIEQQDNSGNQFVIPIEKLCIFTEEKEGSNWEGISVLRPVYGNWYIKKDLMKIDAIKHERYGVGIPMGTAPKGVNSEDDAWQNMEDALRSIYANEQGYIVKPAEWELEVINGGESKGTDVIASIKYHDEAIALGMLAQFLKLGQTESGSRALGSEFIDFFLDSLQDTCEYICQVINRFCLKELVDYNWEVNEYPELKCARIQEVDPQVIANLVSTGIITKDLEIENTIRNRLNLPEINEEEYEKRHQNPFDKPAEEDGEDDEEIDDTGSKKKVAKKKAPVKKDVDEDNLDEEDTTKASDKADRTFVNKTEAEFTTEERIPNLQFIENKLDETEEDLYQQLNVIKEKQIEYIAEKLSMGSQIQNIIVPFKKEMFIACRKASKQQYKFGQEEMIKEVKKQRPDLFIESLSEIGQSINDFMKWQDEVISIDVEGLAGRLLSMMAKQATNIKKRELTDKVVLADEQMKRELSIFGSKMSDKPYKEVSSSNSNSPFGEGRANISKKYQKYIDYMYRSAILDRGLCKTCRPKNGLTFQAETKSKDAVVPDPDCLGGKKCRCMLIVIMKAEEKAS